MRLITRCVDKLSNSTQINYSHQNYSIQDESNPVLVLLTVIIIFLVLFLMLSITNKNSDNYRRL